MDYREKLRKMLDCISNHPNIEVELFKVNYVEKGDAEDDYKWMFQHLKNKKGYDYLPDTFLEQLFFADTFYILYDYSVAGFSARNEVKFREISTLMSIYQSRDKEDSLAFDGLKGEEKVLWDSFFAFDIRPEIGDNKKAVISLIPGVSPPSMPALYYLDRANAFKMSLDYGEYLDAMIDMAGTDYWQYLYTDADFKNPLFSHVYGNLKKSLDALVRLFPHVDYSKYLALLESKNN